MTWRRKGRTAGRTTYRWTIGRDATEREPDSNRTDTAERQLAKIEGREISSEPREGQVMAETRLNESPAPAGRVQ